MAKNNYTDPFIKETEGFKFSFMANLLVKQINIQFTKALLSQALLPDLSGL